MSPNVLMVCLLVMGGCFAVIVGSLLRHRTRFGKQSFHRHVVVELIWILMPVLIVVGSVWPVVSMVFEKAVGK